MKKIIFLSGILFFYISLLFGQDVNSNLSVFQEQLRRVQVSGEKNSNYSFTNRIQVFFRNYSDTIILNNINDLLFHDFIKSKHVSLSLNPILASNFFSSTPYPEVSNFIMSKGYQNFSTIGIQGSLGPLSFQVNPEFIFAQNLDYNYGVLKSTGTEYLERFGNGTYRTFLPGQSSVRLNAGAFSFGASTENIWWGPGQFNSLLFSNNAFGFEHLTLNTRRPARTFLGTFEGQVIMGKLEGSGFESPISNTLRRDWRYMNGINIVYGPKWVPGFFIGISRVYQQYSQTLGSSIRDYFPIFMGLQKEGLVGDSPDSGDFDQAGRDQQLTGYVRYVNPKAKIELYFEYGRRDHAWNWREAILNPEHARAYLFGFQKLINAPNDAHYQIRGEVLQQQESVNILVRYPNLGGGQNWGGHIPVRHGFTHRGQMLGPGIGPSSNVQTLEGAWVKGFKKLGLRLERLNRHQDIYQKRFLDPSEQGRWVDLSARLLADWQFDNLIISSNINFVNSLNYQWQLAPDSTPEFPRGENLFSLHSQVSLIYLFGKQP